MPTAVSQSPPIEQIYDKILDDERKFVFKDSGRSEPVQFPLYFGTDEDEISTLRKAYLSKNSNPPLLPSFDEVSKLMSEHFGIKLTQKQSSSLSPNNNADDSTKRSQRELTSANTITDSSNNVKPSTTSSTLTTTGANLKPKTPVTSKKSSPAPTTPVSAPMSWAAVASSASKPQSITKQSTTSSPSTASPAPNSSSTSVESPVPTKPQQKETTPLKNATSQPDIVSEVTLDNKVNPLGIVLLRLIFDPAYLSNALKNKKTDLVIPHGLNNSGNICYMNSILQFLFACQPFSQMLNIIRTHSVAKLNNNSTPILNAILLLHDSFKRKASEDKIDIIDPNAFYKSIAILPRFSHLQWGRQEDAEEFLGHLLDELHEEFVKEIATLSMTDVKKFAEAFHNKETGKRVIRAVEFIKDENKDSQSPEGGSGWQEIGANKKPAEKRTFEVKYSPIVTLFGGQFKSVLKLPNKKSSITLDPFMQVQLDIDEPQINDLVTAFHKFSQDEEISMGKGTAKKQNFIDKVPSVLIIHLKRFSFVTYESPDNEDNSFSEVVSKGKKKKEAKSQQSASPAPKAKVFDCRIEKIRKFISYDHELVLPAECISTNIQELPKFELTGVVYHHGRDTENGHYTTEIKSFNDEWIKIDDTSITPISADDAISDKTQLSKTAYILMYKKI